jgi:sortase (surface protein transpeptidase)
MAHRLVNSHEQIYRDLEILKNTMDLVIDNFESLSEKEMDKLEQIVQKRVNGLHTTVGA